MTKLNNADRPAIQPTYREEWTVSFTTNSASCYINKDVATELISPFPERIPNYVISRDELGQANFTLSVRNDGEQERNMPLGEFATIDAAVDAVIRMGIEDSVQPDAPMREYKVYVAMDAYAEYHIEARSTHEAALLTALQVENSDSDFYDCAEIAADTIEYDTDKMHVIER